MLIHLKQWIIDMYGKSKRLKNKKLTDSARGKNCTVRIPGVCNHNPETTIFAHIGGAGMGTKASDIHGAYCCSSCHEFIDGGFVRVPNIQPHTVKLSHLEAVVETQQIMIDEGLIKT